jgi:hypothetical protein
MGGLKDRKLKRSKKGIHARALKRRTKIHKDHNLVRENINNV